MTPVWQFTKEFNNVKVGQFENDEIEYVSVFSFAASTSHYWDSFPNRVKIVSKKEKLSDQ